MIDREQQFTAYHEDTQKKIRCDQSAGEKRDWEKGEVQS